LKISRLQNFAGGFLFVDNPFHSTVVPWPLSGSSSPCPATPPGCPGFRETISDGWPRRCRPASWLPGPIAIGSRWMRRCCWKRR